MNQKSVWAIIGAGNGGQSMAGHMAFEGFPVRLYDIVPATIDAINAQGGILIDGVVEGFGPLELATTDLGRALSGVEVVVVVAPAVAHAAIARDCAPHLCDGQVVILHPGATCGALEFRKALDDSGCRARVAVAETNSLIYACRSARPGQASILGIKQDLTVATLPARDNPRVLELLQQMYPQMVGGKNVLVTSLGNANAVMHPAPTILNTSMIESRHEWLYYLEGVTPTVGNFVEILDLERLAVARAFGIQLTPILEWYEIAYGVTADNLSEAVRRNPAYEKIAGQKQLRTRYLLEDVPAGLVPMIELGKLAGVDVSGMELIARLAEKLLGEDFFTSGRTLKNLGLDGMTREEFELFIETGEKAPRHSPGQTRTISDPEFAAF